MTGKSPGAVGLAVALFAVSLVAGCAGKSASYSSVYLSADDINTDVNATAYDVLASHRKLIVTDGGFGFKGGAGSAASSVYYTPHIVVNDDALIPNPVSVLRRIPADDVKEIRLFYGDEVPRHYSVGFDTRGGVIAIDTKSGKTPIG